MFDDDPRWGSDPRERDDDTRDRDAVDPRDVFVETAPQSQLLPDHRSRNSCGIALIEWIWMSR